MVSGVTLRCDSDDTKSTTWSGTYTISDNFDGQVSEIGINEMVRRRVA